MCSGPAGTRGARAVATDRRNLLIAWLVLVLSFAWVPAQAQRLVFAHYMVTNQDYQGDTDPTQEAKIAAYEREIQQAQAVGIDGFALNVGLVTNQGTGPTPAGTVLGVGFDLDGSTAASVWEDTYTASLAPGASVTLTATGGSAGSNYWIATAGSHTVTAWVDDVNRISESNENNNKLTQTISVAGYSSLRPVAQIDAGSNSAVSTFSADVDFNTGNQFSSAAGIDTSAAANPAPPPLTLPVRSSSPSPRLARITQRSTVSRYFNDSFEPSEGDRTCEKLVCSKHHFKPDSDPGAQTATLLGEVLGPGDARAQLHDEPPSKYALSICQFRPVIVYGYRGVCLPVDLHFEGYGAAGREATYQIHGRPTQDTLRLLRESDRAGPAGQPAKLVNALDVGTARNTEALTVLPESRFSQ
jgi:CARDB